MKRVTLSCLIIFALLTTMLLGACGKNHDNDLKVYYLNLDGDEVVQGYYDPSSDSDLDEIDLYLKALSETPEDSDMMQPIPSSVEVLSYEIRNKCLVLNFSENYGKDMDRIQEILARAAIVRTMLQLDNIESVCFLVNGNDLLDSKGDKVGIMSADSFVENPDQAIGTSERTSLTLYFSNSDGTALVPETQTVYYSSNESLEKLIVRKLIEGPNDSDLKRTIPSQTELYNVSVLNGQCVVNFDSTFNSDQDQSVSEEVVLYSIVNSLANLSEVDEVQITVNGDSSGLVRYKYSLSSFYQFNDAVIYHEKQSTEETK